MKKTKLMRTILMFVMLLVASVTQAQQKYVKSLRVISTDHAITGGVYNTEGINYEFVLGENGKPQDMNQGAGGKYVYIGMEMTTDYDKALTSISIRKGTAGEVPQDVLTEWVYAWIIGIPIVSYLVPYTGSSYGNLNESNNGTPLYLYYKPTGPVDTYGKDCITSIFASSNSDSDSNNNIASISSTSVNDGNGGAKIYLKRRYMHWQKPVIEFDRRHYQFDLSNSTEKIKYKIPAASDKLKFTCSDKSVVECYQSDEDKANNEVSVVIKGVGSAYVTMTYPEDAENHYTSINENCYIDVTKIVSSITNLPSKVVLRAGESEQLSATSNNLSNVSYQITEGSEYVSIDAGGKITALQPGKATITASVPENERYQSYSREVTVYVTAPNKLSFSQPTYTVMGHHFVQTEVTSISSGKLTYEIMSGDDNEQVQPSIDANGLFSSKGTTGTVQIKVTQAKTDQHEAGEATAYVQVLPEPYVVFNATDSTITFKYDMARDQVKKPDVAYDIPEGRTMPGWVNEHSSGINKVVIEEAFKEFLPKTTFMWFAYMQNLNTIEGLEYLNTSEVTDMTLMFALCNKMKYLDLSHFDTQKVTDMTSMFIVCGSLTILDISKFSTENVTSMTSMFSGCVSLQSIVVNTAKWNTSNVTSSQYMFHNCTELIGAKGTTFDEEHTDIEYARDDNGATKPGYLISSSVRMPYATLDDEGSMNFWCLPLTNLDPKLTYYIIYEGKPIPWENDKYKVKKVNVWSNTRYSELTSVKEWFANMVQLESFETQANSFSSVKDMSGMFKNCTALKTIDLRNWPHATNMRELFSGCTNLVYANLEKLVHNTLDISNMFYHCDKLIDVNIDGWDTEQTTDMNHLFAYCKSLHHIDVTGFNTSNVTNMSYMFVGCSLLQDLDLSNFDTRNVTTMEGMFARCSKMWSLDVSSFNTDKVTNMISMFQEMTQLWDIDISNFNMRKVSRYQYLFYKDSYLNLLTLGDFAVPEEAACYNAFTSVGTLNNPCALYVSENFDKNMLTFEKKDENYYKDCSIYSWLGGYFTFDYTYEINDDDPYIEVGSYPKGSVTYTRDVKAGNYGSFCFPFDVEIDDEQFESAYTTMDVALYNPTTYALTLIMKRLRGVVPAGTAFIGKLKSAPFIVQNNKPFQLEDDTDSAENPSIDLKVFNYEGADGSIMENENVQVKLAGTYRELKAGEVENVYSFKTNGNFGYRTLGISPYRAYIISNKPRVTAANAKDIILIFDDEEATDISSIIDKLPAESVRVYSIDGKLLRTGVDKSKALEGLPKGVYIVNGKKLIK